MQADEIKTEADAYLWCAEHRAYAAFHKSKDALGLDHAIVTVILESKDPQWPILIAARRLTFLEAVHAAAEQRQDDIKRGTWIP